MFCYASAITERLKDSDAAKRSIYFEDIKEGIHHLHQLGLIHNDLNPSNILTDSKIPIIIDFDSCRLTGEKLGSKTGTFPCKLKGAEFATPENDFHSLEKLRELILEKSDV